MLANTSGRPGLSRISWPLVVCALVVPVVALLVHPVNNMGFVDDPSYIMAAGHLAQTGVLPRDGYYSTLLLFQAALAAIVFRFTGVSFLVADLIMATLSTSLAVLLQRTLRRCGATGLNAAIGTLVLITAPIYLSLSLSFMSDIAGLLALVFALYACVHAVTSGTSRGRSGWLVAAVAGNLTIGSSRQIAWLGLLVMVPAAMWLLRRDRRAVLWGASAWLAGCGCIAVLQHLLNHQLYAVPEQSPLHLAHPPSGGQLLMLLVIMPACLGLFWLPLTLPLSLRLRKPLPWLGVVMAAWLLVHIVRRQVGFSVPFTNIGSWLTGFGLAAVFRPYGSTEMPLTYLFSWLTLPVVAITLAAAVVCIGHIRGALQRPPNSAPVSLATAETALPLRSLLWLLLPTALVYLVFLVPRAAAFQLYDRYELPLLFLLLPLMVRMLQDGAGPRLRPFAFIWLAVVGIWSTLLVQESFARPRAVLQVIDELRAQGVPPQAIDGTVTYNVLSQLRLDGLLNSPGAIGHPYRDVPLYMGSPDCPAEDGLNRLAPDLHPRFRISYDPNTCLGRADVPAVTYRPWLFAAPRTLYAVRVAPR